MPKCNVSTPNSSQTTPTKQALLVDLLSREEGASLSEIMAETGWQSHSVRGALSGTVRKKLGLSVISAVEDGRGRVYRIAPEA